MTNETMTADPDSNASETETTNSDAAPKKRRRRRGRKSGGAGGSGEKQGGSSASEGQSGDQPPEKGSGRSRRGGRGRRGRHGKDDDGQAQPVKRRRRPAEPTEHWEEIFEDKGFAELGLRNSVIKGVEQAGFKHPTKIQSEMIPLVLSGKDVLGQSRTGTGKTAAFGLPLYHLATRELPFQSVILAPTRELAIQIASELAELGEFTPIRVSAVYGGASIGTQAQELDRGPEIIVATPGRLMDMKNRGHIHFNNVRFMVLDEVDRMLDIGFREDIKKILSQVKTEHQTVFVSATISDEIEKLARSYMQDPEKLITTGGSLTVSLVKQHYTTINPWDKRKLLLHVLTHEEPDVTLVFCRMKRTVDEVAKFLNHSGVETHAIHGDMYQSKRNSVMQRLRAGKLSVLVASDLAARGLDVDDITHVINYDLPEDPEVYIHRIGRTARAGRGGEAWSLVAPDQGPLLTQIEQLANTHIPEKIYEDFKPGPVPKKIEQEQAVEQQRIDRMRSVSRTGPMTVPTSAASNAEKFPGGLVPTKQPPKRMQGRVRTSRSMKKALSEGLSTDESPKKDGEN
jgi:ATP-dependent RNA helicase DeaD